MATPPPSAYFLLTTNLSRGQDDATAKKRACTWKREYFRLDGATGLLLSVNEYEDGLLYMSTAAPLPVPVQAQPSTAAVYEAAEERYLAYAKKKREQERKEKEALRLLRDGMKRHEHASEEAGAADRQPAPVPAPALVVDEQPQPVAGQLLDTFTVIDLEFQGSDLLELAAIRYEAWQPVGEYVSFVQFRGQVYSAVTQLTGITGLHVYNATPEKQVLQQFKKLAGDSLLVCHNISADRRVLEAARARQGATSELPNPWLCTLALARKRLPKGQKCGLSELCHHFHIKARGAHRAKRDVEMCYQVLRHLHQQQPVTKGDLHGAPKPGKGKSTVAGPGLLFEAA
ncbi:hypothetical protein GCM10023185_29960 [Hymenobacter saemangeumensis]|uniref:Exonuclease domain-containing protein n=1 Tax=Hymenobacter saemangeumensis TaxID=1084522 RepID=A0ABP8IL87_9BACT